jgi:peptidoglycan/xylan/chitin deacetylase (PgdA/CDA1 family)
MTGRLARWLWSLAWRPGPRAGARLVIVRHHRVYGAGETPLYRVGVSAEVLERQLDMLSAAGLTPVTVSEGMDWLGSAPHGMKVAMTFDDGYADNVRLALPRLAARGARASFFLTAGLIEERRAPWWDTLAHALERATVPRLEGVAGLAQTLPLTDRGARGRALVALLPLFRVGPERQAALLETLRARLGVSAAPPCELATWGEARALRDGGMEVGAHTLTHPFLSACDRERQRAEIAGSRALLAGRLGELPAGFAYPGGDYDDVSLDEVARAGYRWAVATRRGDNGPGTPGLELRRRGLSDGACLTPRGRFSRRLALAELHGAFDRVRGVESYA